MKNILLSVLLLSIVAPDFARADCFECPICEDGCDPACVVESEAEYERAGSNYNDAQAALKTIAESYYCAENPEELK